MELIPLDKMGFPITPGSIIVYGHALDRSAGLKVGKVIDVKTRKKAYGNDSGFSILVHGVDDGWDGKPSLGFRKGTLLFPDRIIVVPRDRVSPGYLTLLDSI